jgi:hypothetical protein
MLGMNSLNIDKMKTGAGACGKSTFVASRALTTYDVVRNIQCFLKNYIVVHLACDRICHIFSVWIIKF